MVRRLKRNLEKTYNPYGGIPQWRSMVHLKTKAMPIRLPKGTERKDTMFPFTRLKGSGVSVPPVNKRA